MKKLLLLFVLCLMCTQCVSCGNAAREAGTKVYYISSEKNSLVPVRFDFTTQTKREQVEEALNALGTDPGEVRYTRTMPAEVKIREYTFNEENSLVIYLNTEYNTLDNYTEILVRAAIVKTLVQIDGVDSVTFYVGNEPLKNAGGIVGAMTSDTFIDDFGMETDAMKTKTVTLYFADNSGKRLVAETREVYYSGNQSIEKVVLDQLLEGPRNALLQRTINSYTALLSVSVMDNICYVNLDTSFESGLSQVTETASVYSIVNSLTELDGIDGVQLLVRGNKPALYSVQADLSSPITKNLTIVDRLDASMSPYIEEEFF